MTLGVDFKVMYMQGTHKVRFLGVGCWTMLKVDFKITLHRFCKVEYQKLQIKRLKIKLTKWVKLRFKS